MNEKMESQEVIPYIPPQIPSSAAAMYRYTWMLLSQKQQIVDTTPENLATRQLDRYDTLPSAAPSPSTVLSELPRSSSMASTGSLLSFSMKKFLQNNKSASIVPKGLCFFHIRSNPLVPHSSKLLESKAYPGSNDLVGERDKGMPKSKKMKRRKKY